MSKLLEFLHLQTRRDSGAVATLEPPTDETETESQNDEPTNEDRELDDIEMMELMAAYPLGWDEFGGFEAMPIIFPKTWGKKSKD